MEDLMNIKDKKSDFGKLLEEYSDIDFEVHKREKNSTVEDQKDLFRPPQIRPDSTIDLHGMLKEDALRLVDITVRDMKARGILKLRIITGKGKHSQEKPVIPEAINELLINLKKSGIISRIEWENRTVENSGSVDVLR